MLKKLNGNDKKIDKENKKFEYEGIRLEYIVSDLLHNESTEGFITIITWQEVTRFSMGMGRTDYLVSKQINVEIDSKNNTWRQIFKSGKPTKFKKIKKCNFKLKG